MKKLKTLDKYIIFSFTVVLIYTAVHITAFYLYQVEMHEIAGLVYGLFGGEVLICALLKKLKLNNAHKKEMKDIELIDLSKEDEANG